MFRLTVLGRNLTSCLSQASAKSTPVASGAVQSQQSRSNTGGPPAKLECFVDGKKVLVDPGTTVLQVIIVVRLTLHLRATVLNFHKFSVTIIHEKVLEINVLKIKRITLNLSYHEISFKIDSFFIFYTLMCDCESSAL